MKETFQAPQLSWLEHHNYRQYNKCRCRKFEPVREQLFFVKEETVVRKVIVKGQTVNVEKNNCTLVGWIFRTKQSAVCDEKKTTVSIWPGAKLFGYRIEKVEQDVFAVWQNLNFTRQPTAEDSKTTAYL